MQKCGDISWPPHSPFNKVPWGPGLVADNESPNDDACHWTSRLRVFCSVELQKICRDISWPRKFACGKPLKKNHTQ